MDLASKSTLKYYAAGKTEIGYQHCYRNNMNSTFLARARTNSLKLEEAIGRGNKHYNKVCKLCEQEEEDLVHFIAKCRALETKRDYGVLDCSIEDPEERMIKFLFRQEDFQRAGKMVKELWFRRKDIMKNRQKMELERRNRSISSMQCRSDPGPERQQVPLRDRPRGNSVTRG